MLYKNTTDQARTSTGPPEAIGLSLSYSGSGNSDVDWEKLLAEED